MQIKRKDKLVQTIYFIDRLHKFVSTVVVILFFCMSMYLRIRLQYYFHIK